MTAIMANAACWIRAASPPDAGETPALPAPGTSRAIRSLTPAARRVFRRIEASPPWRGASPGRTKPLGDGAARLPANRSLTAVARRVFRQGNAFRPALIAWFYGVQTSWTSQPRWWHWCANELDVSTGVVAPVCKRVRCLNWGGGAGVQASWTSQLGWCLWRIAGRGARSRAEEPVLLQPFHHRLRNRDPRGLLNRRSPLIGRRLHLGSSGAGMRFLHARWLRRRR